MEAVEDVVVPSNWAEPSGDDFLMSLCGLRIRDESLVVEGVLAVPLSESWALSCPSATNCSANVDADVEKKRSINAPKAASV